LANESGHGTRAREIALQVDTLPLLPSVLVRVLSLDPESDAYFDQLVELASREPNLAVRLLRYANSAMSAPGRPIHTLQQAAMRIGTQECTHLVTALAVARVFVPSTPAQRDLWRHSLLVAHCSRLVARWACNRREARELSYIAGLLHDIGRFAMFNVASADLLKVSEADWASPAELLATEEQLLGYDHAQLGGLVCERWQMPELLTQVVRLHHRNPLPDVEGAVMEQLRIVRLADAVAVQLAVQPELAEHPAEQLAGTLAEACATTELGRDPAVLLHVAEGLALALAEVELGMEMLMGLEPGRAAH
jgi:HD-like signal output (HDOD) protein